MIVVLLLLTIAAVCYIFITTRNTATTTTTTTDPDIADRLAVVETTVSAVTNNQGLILTTGTTDDGAAGHLRYIDNVSRLAYHNGSEWTYYPDFIFGNPSTLSTLATDLSPDVWIVAGETKDRVGSHDITLLGSTSTTTVINERTAWDISAVTGSAIVVDTVINATTRQWSVVCGYENMGDNTINYWFYQRTNTNLDHTNHGVYENSNVIYVDEFAPSGGGDTISLSTGRGIYAIVHNDAGWRLFKNGIEIGSAVAHTEVYSGGAVDDMVFGARLANSVITANNQQLFGALVFERTLTEEEVASITWPQLLNAIS